MKVIHCPLNGPRNAQEFAYGGEVAAEPGPGAAAVDWSRYVFLENNHNGIADEWWCHVPSSYWFIARRDRSRDEFVATYTVSDYFEATEPL